MSDDDYTGPRFEHAMIVVPSATFEEDLNEWGEKGWAMIQYEPLPLTDRTPQTRFRVVLRRVYW